MFNRYGGEIWLLTLIGTGRVHAVSVKTVNDIFAERIREDAKRGGGGARARQRPTGPATVKSPCLVA